MTTQERQLIKKEAITEAIKMAKESEAFYAMTDSDKEQTIRYIYARCFLILIKEYSKKENNA
jgi:hypothetical protein